MNVIETVLITGAAGFIGSSLSDKLLSKNLKVIAIDNFDSFYDKKIKELNISKSLDHINYEFIEIDILDKSNLFELLKSKPINAIIHLAAKAGVRPSIENSYNYQMSNIIGTQNILDLAKNMKIQQFVFASSSSVYGLNNNFPWTESNYPLLPISPYASSKISCENLGFTYSHLYDIRFIALRFFTVYGPRQRPDLAIHKFVDKIINNIEIQVFGDGSTERDYTYIDDIIGGIIGALKYDKTKFEIFNLGNNKTISLSKLISQIEQILGIKAIIKSLPLQDGDVKKTYANISKAQMFLNYQPKTSLNSGLQKFVNWYKSEKQV